MKYFRNYLLLRFVDCFYEVGLVGGLLLVLSQWTFTQETRHPMQLEPEKLLDYLRTHRNIPTVIANSDTLHNNKCGFRIRAQIHNQWQNFTTLQKKEIRELLQQEIFQKDRIIGRFHIYYDTTGSNEPALLSPAPGNQLLPNTAEAFVDSVGRIFNDVYHIEVEELGYDPPPFEAGESHYRILIAQTGNYGETDWNPDLQPLNPGSPAPRYPCFIDIDNNFQSFYTKGMDALKVTAAHEFHHVIQIGSYGYWQDDIYAHELTSTWMEDVVYTEVNDYYQYLSNYFSYFSRGLSFNYYDPIDFHYGGYERAIWGHFLAKRFGLDIMLNVWTGMKAQPFLESTNAVLIGKGTSLQSEFALFTYWNYFTADRADTVKYYPEGNHYPRFQPVQTASFYGGTSATHGDVEPLSSSMYEFQLANDTITAIIANMEVEAAERMETTTRTVDITLSSGSIPPPYQDFMNGLKAGVSVVTPSLWRSFFLQSSTRTDVLISEANASPNPLRLTEAERLLLPVSDVAATIADVYFFSSSLHLAYTSQFGIKSENGNRVIDVPTEAIKSKLSSGIYFIIAKTANQEYRWKVAVLR